LIGQKAGQVSSGSDWVGGRPLQFQQQHLLIAHAPRAPQDGFDGRVDRFDDADANRMIAVGRNAFDMREQEIAEAFHLWQALPPHGLEPSHQEIQDARGYRRPTDRTEVPAQPSSKASTRLFWGIRPRPSFSR
jgi:hypothetical protein